MSNRWGMHGCDGRRATWQRGAYAKLARKRNGSGGVEARATLNTMTDKGETTRVVKPTMVD